MIHIEQASQVDADVLARLNQRVHRLHTDNIPRFFRQPTQAEAYSAFRALLK